MYIMYIYIYGTYGCTIEELFESILLCEHENNDKCAMYTRLFTMFSASIALPALLKMNGSNSLIIFEETNGNMVRLYRIHSAHNKV